MRGPHLQVQPSHRRGDRVLGELLPHVAPQRGPLLGDHQRGHRQPTAEPGGGEQGPRPPLKSVKIFNPHLYSKAQHKGQSMQRCFVLKFFGYRP